MTRARCDREIACDNVGHRKTFANRRACERELRARASTELTSRACPKGISEHHLEQCLSDVRRETCGNPFHTADRIENCSDAMLCVDD